MSYVYDVLSCFIIFPSHPSFSMFRQRIPRVMQDLKGWSTLRHRTSGCPSIFAAAAATLRQSATLRSLRPDPTQPTWIVVGRSTPSKNVENDLNSPNKGISPVCFPSRRMCVGLRSHSGRQFFQSVAPEDPQAIWEEIHSLKKMDFSRFYLFI